MNRGREPRDEAMPFWRTRRDPSRPELANSPVVPWRLYRCKNGYAAVLGAPFRRWRFARLLPMLALVEAAYRFQLELMQRGIVEPPVRLGKVVFHRYKRVLGHTGDRLTMQWTAQFNKQQVANAGRQLGLAFAPLATLEEVLDSPQRQSREFFSNVTHPEVTTYAHCSVPFKVVGTSPKSVRAPLLGEHTYCVMETLAGGASENDVSDDPAVDSKTSLAGVRVIELAHVKAGPHAGRILADYGAEVNRVESLSRLCVFRGIATRAKVYYGRPILAQLNQNKRSVTLNLRSAGDRQLLAELLAKTDVAGQREWIEDSRFSTFESRGRNHDLVDERIAKWTSTRSHYEAMETLQAAGVPANAVLGLREGLDEPLLRDRAYFHLGGPVGRVLIGAPRQFAGTTYNPARPGADLGQDNGYVKCDLLERSRKSLDPIDEAKIKSAAGPVPALGKQARPA